MTNSGIETKAKTKLIYDGLHLGELTKILTVLTKENFSEFCEKNDIDICPDGELQPFKIEAEDTGYYGVYGFDFSGTYKLIFRGDGWGSRTSKNTDAEEIKIRSDWYDYLKAVHQFIYETTGIGMKES